MPAPNRSALFTKLHKVLKKHYKPLPSVERPVLEHMIYACCLENAPYTSADQAYETLVSGFFDWNEVRVSTVRELAKAMPMLPEPETAASNLKRILYSVFESAYSYDLEALKKQNLGQAIQKLKKYEGTTPFVVAFATQATLGGHSIPVDRGSLEVLHVIGAINDAEMRQQDVPGLERAIPKSKGVEFGSLLHQLGAEMIAGPYAPGLHKVLLEIAPDAKDRLPKRPSKTSKPVAPPVEQKKTAVAKKKAPAPPAPTAHAPAKKTAEPAKKSSTADKHPAKAAAPKKKPAAAAPPKRKPR
jgi:hypothetical protein